MGGSSTDLACGPFIVNISDNQFVASNCTHVEHSAQLEIFASAWFKTDSAI